MLVGEVRGLEVARAVADTDGVRLEVGIGRHDREAFGIMHGDVPTERSLARVVKSVADRRRAGAPPHPLNRLGAERLLRAALVDVPNLVGAKELTAVPPPLPRSNLADPSPAAAAGVTFSGEPLLVVCSTGVDLDLVPHAIDARISDGRQPELVLAVPERDAHPVTRALAAALVEPARLRRSSMAGVHGERRDVLERLDELEAEFETILKEAADPEVIADRQRHIEVLRRHKQLEAIVSTAHDYRQAFDDVDAAKEMITDASADERDELREMLSASEADVERLEAALRVLLLPSDPNDGRNIIVEIRGAEGGEEANLFARDLFEMYRAYAESKGWKFELLKSQPSDMGGLSEVVFMLKGATAWTHLKHEGGPHRVQRVPATESQGRIHTSSATVAVLPEADEVEIVIDPNDLQVDVYRSSGPGGQSVNTTDSAVRITHKPTGEVVSMQDEKSQLQNRAKALQVLRARLLRNEQERQAAEQSAQRRDQVRSGGRSEKIRTYNFKENRVTDHRIGLALYKLDRILGGELEDVVESLLQDERQRQLQATGES